MHMMQKNVQFGFNEKGSHISFFFSDATHSFHSYGNEKSK